MQRLREVQNWNVLNIAVYIYVHIYPHINMVLHVSYIDVCTIFPEPKVSVIA